MLRDKLEINDIDTVGELRQALESIEDGMPIGDIFGDSVTLELEKDPVTGDAMVTFR